MVDDLKNGYCLPNTEEENDEKTVIKCKKIGTESLSIDHIFNDTYPFMDDIKKFKTMCRKEHFDAKPLGTKMVMPNITTTQLNMQIHSGRIIGVVLRMIRKLESVGRLPTYLKHNTDTIKKYLNKDQTGGTDLSSPRKSNKLQKYISTACSTDLIEQDFLLYADIELIMQYLPTNKCLELVHSTKKLPISDQIHGVIFLVKKLLALLTSKLSLTPEMELEREKKLRMAYQEFNERLRSISNLEDTLQKNSEEGDAKIREKDIAIREYTLKVRMLKYCFKNNIEGIIQDSGRIISEVSQLSNQRFQQLSEQAKEAQLSHRNLLKEHLINEKKLKLLRFKVESQVACQIAKYDEEIGERQEQLDLLEEGHEKERKQLLELECQFKVQDEIYKKYKAQKDKEDEAAFTKKLNEFRMSQACRILQRHWRAYRARKLARKKAKKDKARARAARKAKK